VSLYRIQPVVLLYLILFDYVFSDCDDVVVIVLIH